MKPIEQPVVPREQIDQWPVAEAGFSTRVVNCLALAGVKTIGELRPWSDAQLLALKHFGVTSVKNVRWFFAWTRRLEAGSGTVPDARALLQDFLGRDEIHVLEQRYGLTDPLFRPQMKRRTLQDIATVMRRGVTRERVRQIEEAAIAVLRAKLPRTAAEQYERQWVDRMHGRGCVVTGQELAEWVGDPLLGGYQPWGVFLLLSETYGRIQFRYDYFTCLPQPTLNQVERQILQLLHAAVDPVPFERILASVADELNFLNGQRPRLVSVLLDHHPQISGTVDRRYFLPTVAAGRVVADILRQADQPLHLRELTRRYNERMLPHSQRGTGFVLRVLGFMAEAQRVTPAVYQLKTR